MSDQMKAWIVDDCEIYAAATGLEALRAYKDDTGESSAICELLSDEFLDTKYQAYDEDENPIEGEFVTTREILSRATEPGWIASTVVG